jgi:hypothetical protein
MNKYILILLFVSLIPLRAQEKNILQAEWIDASDVNFGYVESGNYSYAYSQLYSYRDDTILYAYQFEGADSVYFSIEEKYPFYKQFHTFDSIKFKFSPRRDTYCQVKVKLFWKQTNNYSQYITLYGNGVNNVKQEFDNKSVSVIPNPASDFVEVDFGNVILSEAKDQVVKIYNFLGEMVITTTPSLCDTHPYQGREKINISELVPGVYFVRVGDRVQRFIKY